jgi:SAM-dependent methyltransferase
MTGAGSDVQWLTALLPFVREQLPPAPARILEIGCGPLGGFVPGLTSAGHHAVGIDPEAPAADGYHQAEFENYDTPQPVDAIVACTSLHHVADIDHVLDRVADALIPGGVIVVIEWAHECFDETTAKWCFARLGDSVDEHNWLRHHRDRWEASGQAWDSYFAEWIRDEGLHRADDILSALDARFERRMVARAPYFFPDLDDVSEAAEQDAIDAGRIRAAGIRYVGQRA